MERGKIHAANNPPEAPIISERPKMETPWSRARRTRSSKQEGRIGKMEGGSKQVNSGRLWRWKRDGILHEFLIEARTTEAGSYKISGDEFLKIRREGLQTPPGLLPGMQIDIQDLSLMVIELSAFQDLYVRLLELEARVGGSSSKAD
jgi:hypothetical protein